jgi:hypothetical protein
MQDNPYESPTSRVATKEPKSRSNYGPEDAYRKSVRPIALFCLLGGLVFLPTSVFAPTHSIHVPSVEDSLVKRFLFGGAAIWLILVGIGLLRRMRFAWYGLFAYITVFACLLSILETSLFSQIGSIIFGSVMIVGIYLATCPTFKRPANNG